MIIKLALALVAALAVGSPQTVRAEEDCAPALDVTKRRLDSADVVHLCEAYQGNVVLVVNTASKCGFTWHYEGLESLYARYVDDGLVVLGFPSNDFGGQEPGTEKQVADFCRLTYSIQFPMFEKTGAAKGSAGPLYQALAAEAGEFPAWNFHKYLLDRSGKVVGSFPSSTAPDDERLVSAIQSLL